MNAVIAVAAVLLLILGGLWVALALALGGVAGLWPLLDSRTFSLVSTFAHQTVTSYTFTAVPLFVFMGDLMNESRLGDRLYTGLSKLLRGAPGGLIQVNIGASAVFAASSGSSVAAVATLGPMSYRQQVKGMGLDQRKVLGSLAAGGTLGILIPPSIILVIYGASTGTSVGALFAAGMVPGIMSVIIFMAYIAISDILARRRYRSTEDFRASSVQGEPRGHGSARVAGLLEIWPFMLLAVAVLGVIYGGLATPTEAAGIGALLTLVLAAFVGGLKPLDVYHAAAKAARTTGVIVLIVIGATIFSTLMVRYGLVGSIVGWAETLTPLGFIAFVAVLYIILGMLFDGISIMLVTLPLLMPVVADQGMDPVWFGIVLVMLIELGLITPPVGLNLFVLHGVTKVPLPEIIRGVLPFIGCDVLRIGLVILVPGIALWLPAVLYG